MYINFKYLCMLVTLSVLTIGCGGGNSKPTNISEGGNSNPESANVPPVAIAQNITLNENQTQIVILNGRDANGDGLTYRTVHNPSHGTFTNQTYRPHSDYVGIDSFTFVANDGTLDSQPATVSINVTLDTDGDNFSDEEEKVAGTDPLDANSVPKTITISGTITYDLVPVNSNGIGLDYNNIIQKPAQRVSVDLVDSANTMIASTVTDVTGKYTFQKLTPSTNVKVRVFAKIQKTGAPSWDVKVLNQKNGNALYVIEGTLTSTGTSNSTRNLNASSGWGGSSYTSTRAAAPFAILDTINQAMNKILSAEHNATFPPLKVYWYAGSVAGTYYADGTLHILGNADLDTDEYDNHIIAHEWGHYYEDKFSRSDSLGGSHSNGEHLDIRVAFSEGFANAFSAIALEDPLYFDTSDGGQSGGYFFNVESEAHNIPGWFSEGSVQRIIYDLYDSHDDGSDTLSLGFAPLHQIFTTKQKNSSVFTSIFNFITYLKEISTDDTLIDSIVSSENIASITDIWGSGRTNSALLYPYHNLTIGGSISIKTSNSENNLENTPQARSRNKLDNRQLVTFTIANAGNYTIKVQQSNGSKSDPDFYLYKGSPFEQIEKSDNNSNAIEEKTFHLSTGSYIIDITDFNNIENAQFNVTLN